MDRRQQQYRLGLLALASFVLLGGLTFYFSGGNRTLFSPRNPYTIIFDDAPGVSPGTPVRRSGVKIGEVAAIDLDDDSGKVRVKILVERKYTIRSNEQPVISQDLLSRDTNIDFVLRDRDETSLAPAPIPAPVKPRGDGGPGEEQQQPPNPPAPAGGAEALPRGEPVPPGSTIRGKTPTDARALLNAATDILPTVQQSLNEIRKTVQRFGDLTPQFDIAVREYGELARMLRETVPELRRTNDEARLLLQTARQYGPELRKTNDEVQNAVRNLDRTRERVDVILRTNEDKINSTIDQFASASARLNNLLNDENRKNVTDMLKNTRAASDRFDSLTKNADDLFAEGRKTAQRFQTTLDQTDQVLGNLRQASQPLAARGESITRNADESLMQLNRLLGDVRGAVGPLGNLAGSDGSLQKLLNDPSLYNNLNAAACGLARVLPRVDLILKDVEVFADKIARHPESIGLGGAVRPSAGLK